MVFVYFSIFFPLMNMQQMPKGRDVEDDDSFVFNDGFTAPLYRIKVLLIAFEHLVSYIGWIWTVF